MKNSIGSTWIFGLAITFTLIFSGFLVVALSYSKTYKLKNEMTSMIEKYEGITTTSTLGKGSISIINDYLKNSGYTTKGKCNEGDFAANDLLTSSLIEVDNTNSSEKYYYCISYTTNKSNCETVFKIKLFFDFNLPVFGDLYKFSVTGSTNSIYNAYTQKGQILCN